MLGTKEVYYEYYRNVLWAWIKILVSTDISVSGFYGYIDEYFYINIHKTQIS